VVPHTGSGTIPVWLGVGGRPESVVRAARYGFSLKLAIIGGPPARFAPFSQLYGQALERFGQLPLPVGVHAPGHVAATDEQAREEYWPQYLEVIRRVSRTRGFALPTKESFLRETGPDGARRGALRRVTRDGGEEGRSQPAGPGRQPLRLKYGMGGLVHESLLTAIELYGTEVVALERKRSLGLSTR
jgi:alkanesulfonate monooxygenase SsuD/methylene tetrahydromethanopterin reductase-like flavin-dependent oxidoreductase (luciferase family)